MIKLESANNILRVSLITYLGNTIFELTLDYASSAEQYS